MYGWLAEALKSEAQIVTASRRLARVLIEAHAERQIASGNLAWPTPPILSWHDWLGQLIDTASNPGQLPTCLNAQQSRVLWERCLRRHVNDARVNMGLLVRQARDAWTRLHEWNVAIDACRQSARGQDQRLFARAASDYQLWLQREGWVDDAGIARLVIELADHHRLRFPAAIRIAGFDRTVPQVESVLEALSEAGADVGRVPGGASPGAGHICRYENGDAELRAAGLWARCELDANPLLRIGIVVSNLEQNAARCARLVRDGMVPGWQYTDPRHAAAVNVSFGSRFSEYPAVAIALLVLRWLVSDLGTREVGLLLLTPLLGRQHTAGRSRLELLLRQLPDRAWSPERLLGALRGRNDTADSADWLERIAELARVRHTVPAQGTPSSWAGLIDDVLRKLNWPGDAAQDSFDFQVVNRWRDLLNELARLELVCPSLDVGSAIARLNGMAGETVFQPETNGGIVQVLGPLEAAGIEFDRLWISGLSASNWPPPGRPLALVSRKLQRNHGMPDAEPGDTLDYARRVLTRLAHSAAQIVFSFAETDGDTEQTMSDLVAAIGDYGPVGTTDPGWHSAALCEGESELQTVDDPVPAVSCDEIVAGGASTIQRQITEPFSAFVSGRLSVRPMQPIASGLAANIRGSLIHEALHALYAELPSRAAISGWTEADIQARIDAAVRLTFRRHRRHADAVLNELLNLEQQRTARLLANVVALDRTRDFLELANVEARIDTGLCGVRLRLRYDRVDRLDDGSVVILDYKTGARRTFLAGDGQPRDMQLVVYACVVGEPVAGLGLVNVNSRIVDIDGAGRCFDNDEAWDVTLAGWQQQVEVAAANLQRGDVRINGLQSTDSARPLSLLSRINELRRDF